MLGNTNSRNNTSIYYVTQASFHGLFCSVLHHIHNARDTI